MAKNVTTPEGQKETKIVWFDSLRDIEDIEVEEHCEANNMEVPEKGSEGWNNIEEFIREGDYEYFEDEMTSCELSKGPVVITGSLGLWYGRREIAACYKTNLWEAIQKCFGTDMAYYKVYLDLTDGALHVNTSHHDGTNCFEIRALSKKGIAHTERTIRYPMKDEDTFDAKPYMFRKIKPSDLWML